MSIVRIKQHLYLATYKWDRQFGSPLQKDGTHQKKTERRSNLCKATIGFSDFNGSMIPGIGDAF